MKTFSSLSAVIGLWLAVSFVLWLTYRLFRRRDHTRQRRAADDAIAIIDEAKSIFDVLRQPPQRKASQRGLNQPNEDETLREDVRNLLNAIEGQSAFFERVNSTRKNVSRMFSRPDFEPLAEILQVRRDFWAASEVLLMEDIGALGAELTDHAAYDDFRSEARALLFSDRFSASVARRQDPLDLRLSLASDETVAFRAEVERQIESEQEKGRLPKPSDVVTGPLRAVRSIGGALRGIRHTLSDLAAAAQSLARTMTSKGLKGAVVELRRARDDLPSQFAAAFERAGPIAQGSGGLKRHYEFLLEARELRARYAELLAKTPQLTDKGRQFLARLELERRAEQFRETSDGVLAWARQKIVIGIAYTIAGLQVVQARVTPPENKQLVQVQPAVDVNASPTSGRERAQTAQAPLRVFLPAVVASAGQFGDGVRSKPFSASGEGTERGRTPREALSGLRNRTGADEAQGKDRPRARKVAKGSLLDRLSSVDEPDDSIAAPNAAVADKSATTEKPSAKPTATPPSKPSKPSRFRIFKSGA